MWSTVRSTLYGGRIRHSVFGQKEHVERPGDILGIGIKEEVTALQLKMAGHGFRQNIVFFVDGLPPTPTPLDAGADDSAVQPLLTSVEGDPSHI